MSNQTSCTPSTTGKVLIATNAGAICSCIAALTSLRRNGSIHFKSSFDDFFQGRRSAHHATDHQSRMGDLTYLKNLAQCFSLELCRYSRVSSSCRSVVTSGLEEILGLFLEAFLDPQIIHRLPSSNKAIISISGGPQAQETEVKYLKRMLRRSPPGSQDDDEAAGARLLDNESFDSPGPAFMASRMWSFARTLGGIIVHLQPEDQEILSIGKILSRMDSDFSGEGVESCQRSLALVPLISMERECMKRTATLRGIASVLLSDDHIIGRVATNVLSLITKNVMQNIYYLSATVEYNESRTGDWKDNPNADPEDLYERSRALALQRAYGEVASTLFAWLLHQGAHSNNLHRINPTVVVLKDVLLRTSLHRSSINYCAALEAYSSKSIPPYVFDVLSSRGGSSSGNDRLAEDLDGLGGRYHELVLYAADSFNSSGTTDVLSLLIESAIARQPGGAKNDRAALLGWALSGNRSEQLNSAYRQDDLQRAIDSYLATVHTFKPSSERDRQLLGKLRRTALRNFIVPKLRFDAIEMEKKASLLHIVLSLVSANNGTAMSNIIRPDKEGSGYLDTSDLCLLLRCLTHVLKECLAQSTDLSRDMLLTIFQVAKKFISLPTSKVAEENNTEPLLAWSKPPSQTVCNRETTSARAYISLNTRWLNSIARLLTNDICYQVIQRIAMQAQSSSNRSQSWDMDLLTSLNPPAECLDDDLAAIKVMLQLAQDLDELDTEIYPNDRLQIPGRLVAKNVYAKRPVASIVGDRNHGTSSSTVLGPRCKRTIKEYISEYLSLI